MRGKVAPSTPKRKTMRITPAYAGKSPKANCISGGIEDHPRLCGEKCLLPVRLPLFGGSPPPMRGKVSKDGITRSAAGITPAYAGKSRAFLVSELLGGDHPRLCGEKSVRRPSDHKQPGSPPPMRGKDTGIHLFYYAIRITPAYAGKRVGRFSSSPFTRDHPRLCGEKERNPSEYVLLLGSPPPMRGKVLPGDVVDGDGGITPAYAGKSGIL